MKRSMSLLMIIFSTALLVTGCAHKEEPSRLKPLELTQTDAATPPDAEPARVSKSSGSYIK